MASVGAAAPSVGATGPAANPYLQQQMSAQAPNTSVNLSGLFPGNSGLQSVVSSLQAAQNAANQANQTRYQDILGTYASMGQSGAQQIQAQTQQNQAQNTQNMIGSGLGNTTLTSAMSNQINSMGQMNQLNLQDTLSGQEANAMMQMNQNGPNVGQYASLLQAAANRPQGGTVTGANNGSIGGPVGFGPSTYNPQQTQTQQGGTAQPSSSSPTFNWAGQGMDASGNLIASGGDFTDSGSSDTQGSQFDDSSEWE